MATSDDKFKALIGSLGLDGGDEKRLIAAMGTEDTGELLKRLDVLQRIALRESVEWMVSSRRFTSLSEMDGARVLALFLEVRHEYPTVDQLVDELGIPSSRAVSMLGRLKYGQGRALGKLGREAAIKEIEKKLADAPAADGRKALLLTSAAFEEVAAADFAIMSEYGLHAKGQQYAGAESADFGSKSRQGGTVRATVKMWDYLLGFIKAKAA